MKNKTRTSVLIPLLDLFTTSELFSDAVTKCSKSCKMPKICIVINVKVLY